MGRAKNRRKRLEKERANGMKRNGLATLVKSKGNTNSVFSASECFGIIKRLFNPEKPKWENLTFSDRAWVKLNCYINLVGNLEVTGLGKIEDGVVTDVRLINQTVRGTLVDCTEEAMIDFIKEIGVKEIGKWSLDWHSHVNMGVTPSGTDTANWRVMFEARENNQFPVMIINKRQEVYCHCYMGDGISEKIDVTYRKPKFNDDELRLIYNECKRDIEAKCIEYKYTPVTSRIYPNQGNFGWEYDYQTNTYTSNDDDDVPRCSMCDRRLYSPESVKRGVCLLCFQKHNCEPNAEVEDISKCASCGAELSASEEKNGVCDDCAEALIKE